MKCFQEVLHARLIIPSFIYEFLFSEKFFSSLAGAGARSSRGFSRLALGMEDFLETKFYGSIKTLCLYLYSIERYIYNSL